MDYESPRIQQSRREGSFAKEARSSTEESRKSEGGAREDTEEWRAVVGYEGLYEVSNLGRVREADTLRIKPVSLTGKYAKIGRGYLATRIAGKLRTVHRMVSQAFIPNPMALPEVNHINGKTTDNHITNLEWVSASRNQIHAIQTGLRIPLNGENIGTSKFTRELINEARKLVTMGMAVRAAARATGISRTHLRRIVKRESWQHI